MKAFSFVPGTVAALLIGTVLSPAGGVELPFPAELFEAIVSSPLPNSIPTDRDRYAAHVALSGDTAVATARNRADLFRRRDGEWRYQGTLTPPAHSSDLNTPLTVALEDDTLILGGLLSVRPGYINMQKGAAYVFDRSGAPGRNAWNVTDEGSATINYSVDVTEQAHAAARTDGWHYQLVARFVHRPKAMSLTPTMVFRYGDGEKRYAVYLDINYDGDLMATLPGASPASHILTAGAIGATDYHTHEMTFDPDTEAVTYRFNGNDIHKWFGDIPEFGGESYEGILWGSDEINGAGRLNVHAALFEITDGEVLAAYDAGTAGDPVVAPDPVTQGWTLKAVPDPGTYSAVAPQSPDPGEEWKLHATLTGEAEYDPSNPHGPYDLLGGSLAMSGDTVVVGAYYERLAGKGYAGAAYVFERNGDQWVRGRLNPNEILVDENFGYAVDIDEDRVVVGAPSMPYPWTKETGRAIVFKPGQTGWSQMAELKAGDGAAKEGFGSSVAMHGDRIAVGALYAALDGNTQAGAVYEHLLYGRDGESGKIRAQYEEMHRYYGEAERDPALAVEAELRKGLAIHPDDPTLGNLLLDIYYDRTQAEIILARKAMQDTEHARMFAPRPPGGFLIDQEIPIHRDLLELRAEALRGYFVLLKDDLGIPGDPPLGYRIFRDLVPTRGLAAAMYQDEDGNFVPVINDEELFGGYKDLTLLFSLLRDYGRTARTLGWLLAARKGVDDIDELAARIAEARDELATRYFADPAHRLWAEASLVEANLHFAGAQRWLFFMLRAFEYKWNRPFSDVDYVGRNFSAATLFRLRNADELNDFFHAMIEEDQRLTLNRVPDDYWDWFSMRRDFMGLRDGVQYVCPETGGSLDAIGMFRAILEKKKVYLEGSVEIQLEFNTVRQIPGGSFFLGPTFDSAGNVHRKGLYLDKIDWLGIRLRGDHSTERARQTGSLTGSLTYGGTSFIRNVKVGQRDPDRSDRFQNEMTAYSTRYWFYDQGWMFRDAYTDNAVQMQFTNDPRGDAGPPTVFQNRKFIERSVAATGWILTLPLKQGDVHLLRLEELEDIEIYFYHYALDRN